MLKEIQSVVNIPLKWYADRFKLTPQEVRFTVRFLLAGAIVLNLITAGLILAGMLPR